VAIGNDLPNTSFSAYHYDGQSFYYLDFSKLKEIAYDQAVLETFMDELSKGIQNNKIENLPKLFYDSFGHDISILKTKQKQAFGLVIGETILLKEILKTNDEAYISGSTLKGAIKGALLNNFILQKKGKIGLWNKDSGKEENGDLIQSVKNKQKGKIAEIVIALENELFGKITQKNNTHWSNKFRVLDSSSTLDWKVTKVHRLSLLTGQSGASFLQEIIPKQANFSTAIEIDTYANLAKNNSFPKIDTPESIKKIFEIIQQESNYFIDYEVERLSKIQGVEAANVLNFYKQLQTTIKQNLSKTYLRVGSGKTYFQNSIALALKRLDNSAFLDYLKLYNNSAESEVFPTSRAIVAHDFEPLGWIELSLNENMIGHQKQKIENLKKLLLK
jgi:CRISPR type III-A-associated RAMP protein Csm5